MSLHLSWNFCGLLLLIWDSPFELCSCPSSQDQTLSYCELSSQPWRPAKVHLHKAVSSEVKSALSENRHLVAWLVCHALCNERWLFILIYLHMLLIAASLIFFFLQRNFTSSPRVSVSAAAASDATKGRVLLYKMTSFCYVSKRNKNLTHLSHTEISNLK